MPTPMPHMALVTVTGWPRPTDTGIQVGHLQIHTRWRPGPEPGRVTVRAYPQTRPDGSLHRLYAFPSNIHRARMPNGTGLTVVGQLLRIDRNEGLIRVKVCPGMADTEPFVVTMQASSEVLAFDPGTFSVRVTGRVLNLRWGVLLADQVAPVYAPVPERWHRHRVARPPQVRALLQTAAD
ncbi:hypothetical protein [Deinococcus multiflagellatus]|uniref:Uncharacterized protein n=1 Tax=Deinococcus multiflagellatus TaxID=1656887 RepID=A0ABW1ZTT5_9DEIO|nr:hypothetical protein [Deinococcus multiflagellatus]MBZ9715312.1 hypothetical protein [Deinococcus multiflagellatus]